ncbi:MAG: glutamine--fructose-6-phosphate aminotransferase [Planctomycetes bacterium RIFCSPLOWO2_12_FULL_50_35]|nr:MAG: glutamine--fructose-6-phosphate aminotransferase [Planctomycetes bacterium RIFCSPLOWO2_02_FULL_50_16]OHC03647.1 MAG: glutamine--fructose-6-phosphate aminotransferase [Planctomycetes bacterium RIFCSPLOWO2_12_FULL_50_35]
MCGIIGYVGDKEVLPILIEGLKRLEYRGYDSAGVAYINPEGITCVKSVGKVEALSRRLEGYKCQSTVGIAHTRWATHGLPSINNAHPHIDRHQKIALVHNGIIENHGYLRSMLERDGYRFVSDTDTEVLVHLVEKYFRGDLSHALGKALCEVEGTYGLAVISQDDPEKVVVARCGSPLAVGLGEGEHFVTSDVAAILNHTRKVIYLEDHELAVLTKKKVENATTSVSMYTEHLHCDMYSRAEEIQWNVEQIEKKGYRHFMHKEIHEQPESLLNTMRGRMDRDGNVRLGVFFEKEEALKSLKRILIVACGTSWHAGLVGEYMLEEFARIPVEVEYASEFRYRKPIIEEGTVVLAISQSGETADTLAALKEAKKRGATTLSVCNVVGSTIARESEGGIYLHAGPEIGVASTKAFTSQIAALYLLTVFLGRRNGLGEGDASDMIKALREIPEQVDNILHREKQLEDLAELYKDSENVLYLGRGYNFPVALEGALKLKEISYIHAEGYPAAEMKHGPIALITKDMPVVFIATRDSTYGKILGNIEEVKARGGKVIAIATHGDREIRKKVDHVFYIPEAIEPLTPILSVIPLQLLAYHMAVMRGCDVDKPRNLAKSVTVE